MGVYSNIKAAIAAAIKTNTSGDITGNSLQSVLNSIVQSVGNRSSFMGMAVPGTIPEASPDAKQFYFATANGVYTNFGGVENTNNSLLVFYNNDTTWEYANLTNMLASSTASAIERSNDASNRAETAFNVAVSAQDYAFGVGFCNVMINNVNHIFQDPYAARSYIDANMSKDFKVSGMVFFYLAGDSIDDCQAIMDMLLDPTKIGIDDGWKLIVKM